MAGKVKTIADDFQCWALGRTKILLMALPSSHMHHLIETYESVIVFRFFYVHNLLI